MSTPFLGQVSPFAFDFPPRDWARCSGQLMPIAQNQALFALLGTSYGGNGQTTFALPDLRGRVPIGFGDSGITGLFNVALGQQAGTETVTLLPNQIPSHTHQARASSAAATTGSPANAGWVAAQTHYSTATPNAALAADATGLGGGGLAHENMSPSLVVNFCIATAGIFPSRN
jgi:microcystin-dependent protein